MAEHENSKSKSSWGGKRDGSGRPKGGMNETTKLRMAAKAEYQKRVVENVDKLFNSQFNLATGEQYLMCKKKVGSGASARTVTEIVDSPEVIKQFINGELNDSDDEWYFIATKPANGMALDSMLNRAFGKPEEKLDITSNEETIGSGLSGSQVEQLLRARAGRDNS